MRIDIHCRPSAIKPYIPLLTAAFACGKNTLQNIWIGDAAGCLAPIIIAEGNKSLTLEHRHSAHISLGTALRERLQDIVNLPVAFLFAKHKNRPEVWLNGERYLNAQLFYQRELCHSTNEVLVGAMDNKLILAARSYPIPVLFPQASTPVTLPGYAQTTARVLHVELCYDQQYTLTNVSMSWWWQHHWADEACRAMCKHLHKEFVAMRASC